MAEVLVLIPARGGSKSVPRKNLREVGGKPLIVHAIDTARRCASVGRIVVSTDDAEIADAASRAGADVPFLRPAALAADDTPDLPVLEHALGNLADDGYKPFAVVWLRPTSPLRTPEDVDAAVELLRRTDADSVRSVCLAEHHPYWMKVLEGDKLHPLLPDHEDTVYSRRQLLPDVYRLNGAVEVIRCDRLASRSGSMYGTDVRGYVMPRERSVDVDDESDLKLLQWLAADSQGRLPDDPLPSTRGRRA